MNYLKSVERHNSSVKEANRKNHNYTPNARKRGTHQSKFSAANFLAWDGEGIQKDDDTQVYGLLANSNGDYIINPDGLSTQDCLDFLTSDEYPDNTIHCCFGASYDVNKMLRDLSEEQLRSLHKGNDRVIWNEYELEYRARKSFTVRKFKLEERDGLYYRCFDEKTNHYIFEKSIDLWDVFGFFQKKFVSVMKEWITGTRFEYRYKDVIKDIEEGKEKRGNFDIGEMESFVLPYCLNECEALRDIMHILQEYLDEAKLVLSRWDGAGAIAAAALKYFNVKQHIRIGEHLEEEPYPPEVMLAAEFAYFGGWIEAFMFGNIEWPVYHYDIRSAYPSATVDLPSLTMGCWDIIESVNALTLDELMPIIKTFPSYWIAHIEWSGGPIYGPGPFSWRNKKGNVTRPVQGRGWQWSPEILAAYELYPDMKFKIDKIYYFIPNEDNVKPFAFVAQAYELRKQMKAADKGIEKVYKLYLNSLYGKLAQSLGYNQERGIKPPYHCLVYAGLITSITRAKLMRAVMQKPLAIISVATDGIYSLEPLDLDEGEGLGQWEFTKHESMTIVQPGFYWFSTNGKESHYYRGFNEKCIKRQDVIDALKAGKYYIDIPVTRFVTIGAAIGLNNFKVWGQWRKKDRTLDLAMVHNAKRKWRRETFPGNPDIKIARVRMVNPKQYLLRPELLESTKYSFEWDEEDQSYWEGQRARTIAEEMFAMELATDE